MRAPVWSPMRPLACRLTITAPTTLQFWCMDMVMALACMRSCIVPGEVQPAQSKHLWPACCFSANAKACRPDHQLLFVVFRMARKSVSVLLNSNAPLPSSQLLQPACSCAPVVTAPAHCTILEERGLERLELFDLSLLFTTGRLLTGLLIPSPEAAGARLRVVAAPVVGMLAGRQPLR